MGLIPLHEGLVIELPVLTFGKFHDAGVNLGTGRGADIKIFRLVILSGQVTDHPPKGNRHGQCKGCRRDGRSHAGILRRYSLRPFPSRSGGSPDRYMRLLCSDISARFPPSRGSKGNPPDRRDALPIGNPGVHSDIPRTAPLEGHTSKHRLPCG